MRASGHSTASATAWRRKRLTCCFRRLRCSRPRRPSRVLVNELYWCGLSDVRLAPIATKVRSAVRCREVPRGDLLNRLFDHSVGLREDAVRNTQPQRGGSSEVHREFKYDRLL